MRSPLLARALAAGLALLAVVAAVALSACGEEASSSPSSPAGTVVSGPGVSAAAPPFAPEYAKLPQRIRIMGLPPVGKETYHVHAMLRIYRDGLLVPVPADIGIDTKRKVIASIHTHDRTGVLHFEADEAFPHTLGDVFEVWGVELGPDRLGSLRNGDGRTLRVYVDGQQVADPAAHVIRKDDVIVIRFDDGSQNVSVTPDTKVLEDANAGKGACGTEGGKTTKSCAIMEDAKG